MAIARRFCPVCNGYIAAISNGPNHVLHLLITVLLCGFWLPVWILLALSATYNCQKCGTVTHSGKLVAQASSAVRFVAFVMLAIFIVFLFVGIRGWNSGLNYPKQTQRPAAAPAAQNTRPQFSDAELITVEATALQAFYEQNEIAADQRFKDKWFKVSGLVQSVGTDILGSPYIAIEAGDDTFFCVQCVFARDNSDDLASLRKGQRITIAGKGSGKMGNVLVRECRIVRQDLKPTSENGQRRTGEQPDTKVARPSGRSAASETTATTARATSESNEPDAGPQTKATPRLGLGVVSLDEVRDRLNDIKLPVRNGGVVVMQIRRDSPADKAGIAEGDIITSIESNSIANADEMGKRLATVKGIVKLRFTCWREGPKGWVKTNRVVEVQGVNEPADQNAVIESDTDSRSQNAADEKLRQAKQLLDAGRIEPGKKRLEDLQKQYPNTEAAREAEQLLKDLK